MEKRSHGLSSCSLRPLVAAWPSPRPESWRRDRRVAPLGGPGIVRSDARDQIFRRDAVFRLRDVVEARVVHDRRRVAHLVDPVLVADLLERIHGAGLHVVLEAERVADFVRHDVFEKAAHQIVRQRQLLRARIERSDLHEVPVARPGSSRCDRTECPRSESRRCAGRRCAGRSRSRWSKAASGSRNSARPRDSKSGSCCGGRRFLADDGVLEAGRLERLVPVFDALLQPRHPLGRASRNRCSRRSASRARRWRRVGSFFSRRQRAM